MPEMVKLKKSDGSTQEFEFEHAVRILNYCEKKGGSWKIDPKSEFKYKNGNLIRKNVKPKE